MPESMHIVLLLGWRYCSRCCNLEHPGYALLQSEPVEFAREQPRCELHNYCPTCFENSATSGHGHGFSVLNSVIDPLVQYAMNYLV